MLQDLIKELKADARDRKSIPQSQVRTWMRSEDADTLGATYVLLSKPEHVKRITPAFDFDFVFEFMLRYYEFCLETNPRSEWANSNYSAGSDFVGWFVMMWDEHRDKKYFDAIKTWLERLYIRGSPDVRKCVEHAIVEHLFERKPIREFFADWQDTPEFRKVYDEGMIWIKGGGTSPLTQRRKRS